MPSSPVTTPWTLLRPVLASMLLTSIAGCRSLRPELRQLTSRDSLYQAVERFDSLHIVDRSTERYRPSSYHYDTLVHAYLRVDTLFRDNVKTEYRYRLLHDTCLVQHTDTLTRVIYADVPASPKPPAWSWLLLLALFLLLLFRR